MSPTVTIHGSHGTIIADRATGTIIEYDRDCWCGEDYDIVGRIDPISIQNDDQYDILNVAYWTHQGQYEPALTPVIDHLLGDLCVDWTQLAVLPAPETMQ